MRACIHPHLSATMMRSPPNVMPVGRLTPVAIGLCIAGQGRGTKSTVSEHHSMGREFPVEPSYKLLHAAGKQVL